MPSWRGETGTLELPFPVPLVPEPSPFSATYNQFTETEEEYLLRMIGDHFFLGIPPGTKPRRKVPTGGRKERRAPKLSVWHFVRDRVRSQTGQATVQQQQSSAAGIARIAAVGCSRQTAGSRK